MWRTAPHYPLTLRNWGRRFEEQATAAQLLAGPDRYRIWRMYMAGMAHAFDRGWLSVVQVLAYKPGKSSMAARPWSREYQYHALGQPAISGGSDHQCGERN